MTKQEFIQELAEIQEIDDLKAEDQLSELPEFNFLAVMSIVALVFSKFRKKLTGTEVKSAITVDDLLLLIGSENFKG